MSKVSEALKELGGTKELLAEILSPRPKNVDGQYNRMCSIYKRQLMDMIMSRFRFRLPDWWDYDYFVSNIFTKGYLIVGNTSAGVIPQKGSISGVNIWNRPLKATIINAVIGTFDYTIGVDCCLVKIGYDYTECAQQLVNHYAEMLASCDCSIDVNLMNTRVATVFECVDKAQEMTAKKMYDDISCGKPAVFIKAGTGLSFYQNNVKNTYISDDIMLLKSKIYAEFLTKIGVNNANTDKRERLITDEVEANNAQMMLEVRTWLFNLNKSFAEVNKMFGLNCAVELVDLDGSVDRTDEKESGSNGKLD